MKIVKNIYIIVMLMVLIFVQPIAAQQNQKSNTNMGCLIVLNKSANTATLIDLNTDQPIKVLPTGNGPHVVAVSPDGHMAVAGIFGTGNEPGDSLVLMDLNKHRLVESIKLGQFQRPHGLVFLSNSNRLLVTAEAQKALLLLDLDKKGPDKIIKTFPTNQETSHMVAAAADNRRAFVANIRSGSVSVIDLSLDKGNPIKIIPCGKGTEGLDVSPDGKEVWVSNRAEDTLSVIDAAKLEIKKTIKCASFPIRLKFTPDGGQVLVSNARSGDVAVFDTKSYQEIYRVPMKAKASTDTNKRLFKDAFGKSPVPIGILMHPTGKWAYVANAYVDKIAVIDLKERKLSKWITAGKEPDGLAFAPGGQGGSF